ncbi:MAG: biotin synthase BioB [Fimbriimonadaceae bacterium]|nr:biotin synthase BioB [Alphaproteobacteria bacterium]
MNFVTSENIAGSKAGNADMPEAPSVRSNWTFEEVGALFALPFNDLLHRAHQVYRAYFDVNEIQLSTLLSIKTGGCPEDCKYCSQSSRYDTGLEAEKLMMREDVLKAARAAKENGAGRFCMGAAWRELKDRDVEDICNIISDVKNLGLETCVTLGMVNQSQAEKLGAAGLDYYNHNIDTSENFYGEVISTRTFADRLETLDAVRGAGINVCCGGIVGMGESEQDRISMLHTLATLPEHPGSVPINMLVPVPGTPFADSAKLDIFDFIRTIAVARILMPASRVRLSAGRTDLSEEAQALAFFAGANSIFYGEELLTTPNPDADGDKKLMQKLGLTASTEQHT